MWMINPRLLCRKHLLGEHSELHKHIPSFKKKYSIDKRVMPNVQIELSSFKSRHDELANEILRRGYKHESPIEQPDFSYLPKEQYEARVDVRHSLIDLRNRCDECRKLIDGW